MCGSNRPRTTPYPGRGGDITELSCSAPRDIISTYDAASGDITRHTTLSLPIPGQKQGHHNIFGNCRDITKNVYFMPGEGQGYHLWSCFMFGDIQERFIELMKKASHSFHFLHVTHQKVTNSDLKNQ